MSSMTDLKMALAERTGTNPSDWYLVFKARYGMEVVFEALRDELGVGDVVTQLFTCCTAVDPIVAAGLTPRYVDVSADTLAVDPERLALDARTRAVVIQHTFGIMDSAADARVRDAAHRADALVVEDNAHCVGRIARDAEGAAIADVSIHSFGVEKMLPGCYFGGAVWVNPTLPGTALRRRIVQALSSLPPLSVSRDAAARHYHNQLRILTRLPGGLSHAMRARWEARGTFEPAVAEAEQRGELPLRPQGMSTWVAEQALQGVGSLDALEARHRVCVARYLEVLSNAPGVEIPAAVRGVAAGEPLLRFPVTLANRELADKAIARVAELGFYAVGWYRPLLLPGALDPAAFSYDVGATRWPVTDRLSAGAVDLPCDIEPDQAEAVARAVAELVAGASPQGTAQVPA